CLVSQDSGYQIFATCATFYVPLVAILILYWQIYQVARKRIRHKPGAIRPISLWVPAADGSTLNSTCPNDMLPAKQKKKRDESKRE
ncbi:5-hydroxytryptamine receptor 2B, partial [Stegodyphus mimosarum]